MIEKGVKEVLHADDVEAIEKALEKAFNGTSSSMSCKYKTSDGNYISVVQSFKPDYAANEKVAQSVKSVAMIELEVEN